MKRAKAMAIKGGFQSYCRPQNAAKSYLGKNIKIAENICICKAYSENNREKDDDNNNNNINYWLKR